MILRISRGLNYAATVMAILLTAFTVLSAVLRYLAGSPLRYTEELVGLLFISMCFLSIPLGLVQREHVTVTLLIQYLPRRLFIASEIIATMTICAFAGIFAFEAFHFTETTYSFNARSEVGDILLYPWMALLPGVATFVFLISVLQLIERLRNPGDINRSDERQITQ